MNATFSHRLPRFLRTALALWSLILLVGSTGTLHAQPLILQDNLTATQMVQTLVGSGITFLNPVLTCPGIAAGRFIGVGTELGMDSGIVLSSGRIITTAADDGINGPATTLFQSSAIWPFPGPGDTTLDSLLHITNPSQNTTDACVLEFDFIPDGDSLIFEYIFGSEEYPDFACTNFNDIFAFMVSGPGIPTAANLALIPGTNIPVAINSVNPGPGNSGGDPADCIPPGISAPYVGYYVDNEGQGGQFVAYNGFTRALSARTQVVPCTTYHIKLAISDVGDQSYDSGVFLAANSFRSTNIKLELASSLGSDYNYLVEGCSRGEIKVKRPRIIPIAQSIYLTYGGTATRNQDYFNVPDSVVIPLGDSVASFTIDPVFDGVVEGQEVIQVNVINACNGIILDSIFFDIRDYLPSTLYSDDTTVCQYTGRVLLHVGDDRRFNWSWRDGLGVATIENDTAMRTYAYVDTSTTFYVSASAVNPFGTCFTDTSEFNVTIEPKPLVTILNPDTTVCLREPFRFRVDVGPKWFTGGYNYLWIPNLYLNDPFAKEPLFFNQDYRQHRYVLTVQTPLGCQGSDTSNTITTRPPLDLQNITRETTIRYGDSIRLNVDSGDYYTWAPPFSLNNANIQDPLARPKETTTYTVYAWNRYGCRDTGFVKVNVDFAMTEFIPTAFTPNGDGRNDEFRIFNLRYQKIMEFRIVNRYGQEVFYTTNPTEGWNGRRNNQGEPLDMGVYHYFIRTARPDGTAQMYKGDVMLMR